jgi:type I restriction enzyme, S subunit
LKQEHKFNSEGLFEIPDFWTWAISIDVCLSVRDVTHDTPKYVVDNGIPLVTSKNLKNGYIDFETARLISIEDRKQISFRSEVENGDILFAMIGTIGNPIAVNIDRQFSIKNIGLFKKNEAVIQSIFLRYWLLSEPLNKILEIQRFISGTTQKFISLGSLRSIPIPLPPLNEQRRIVSTIEQLTDRSHKARAALEDVPKLIAQFRQSVLAAAFRGDLTADWREKNSDDEWQITILDEIIHGKPRNGYSPKPVDFPTSVKSLTISSTTSGIFKPEHFKYINEDVSRDSYLWLVPGDILLQRGNTLEYVGTSAIYTGELFEFIYPDLMIKLQIVKEKALPEFIHYQLSSEATRKYFKSNATGTAGNMPKINQKIVMETPIFLPSLKEQLEIMKKIKQMFDGIELLQSVCMESKEELNQLDRSILATAFRGELVSQDPNDEPAAALLERIRIEREQTSTPKQHGKNTRKNSSKQLSIDLE